MSTDNWQLTTDYFKSFAENKDSFVHTIHQRGSAMGWNRNEQRGALPGPCFSVLPHPPYPAEAVCRPHIAHNMNIINDLYFTPVNQTVTKNP